MNIGTGSVVVKDRNRGGRGGRCIVPDGVTMWDDNVEGEHRKDKTLNPSTAGGTANTSIIGLQDM